MKRRNLIAGMAASAMLAEVGAAPWAALAQSAKNWPGNRTFLIGFAQDHMANDWRAAQVRDLERALARYPFIRLIVTDSGGKTAQQIADIEDLAARGIDILITSPRDSTAMMPVISSVYKKGIPVILLSRGIDGPDFTTVITASNRDIAKKAANHLARRLKGKGRILILQHIPTTTPGRDRTEAFQEEIAKYPGIEIAAIKRADSLRGLAIQKIEEALAEKLKFDAIYAQSDSMAAGARIALEKVGIDPATIPTVGIDYIAEARDAIRKGLQDASFTYPTFGKEGAETAVQLLQGLPVPKEIMVESQTVTKDNVEKIEAIF